MTRRNGPGRPKPLADLIEECIGPAFAAQGFASTDILSAWSEIVGERLARYCRPAKLEWPRRRKGDDEQGRPDSAGRRSKACRCMRRSRPPGLSAIG